MMANSQMTSGTTTPVTASKYCKYLTNNTVMFALY